MITSAVDRLRIFNVRDMILHKGRTLVSIDAIAISALLIVAVMSISTSITGSINALSSDLAGKADLEISGITDTGFSQSLQPRISKIAGVQAAVPILHDTVKLGSKTVLLIGSQLSAAKLHSSLEREVQDKFESLVTVPQGVIVGPGVGMRSGDRFALGLRQVTAAAVVDGDAARRLNGGRFVFAPLQLAQELVGRTRHLDSIYVVTAAGVNISEVRSRLVAAVDGRAVVATPALSAAQTGSMVGMLGVITLGASGVSLVVAAFFIYNTMSMAVARRQRMISLLRAVGGRQRALAGDLVAEAIVVGSLGGLFGSVAGVFVGRWAIGRLPSAIAQAIEVQPVYILPWYLIPIVVVACAATSAVVALFAARQVYRVSPVEALAPVGISSAGLVPSRLRVLAGCIAVLAYAGAVLLVRSKLGKPTTIAMALSFTAGVCLCFAFMRLLIRAAELFTARLGAAGRLGAVTISAAPIRAWVTLATVAIAVASTVTIISANNNVVNSIVGSFSTLAETDAWVSTSPADMLPTSGSIPADAEAQIRRLPGVRGISPGQMAFGTVAGTRVLMEGLAPGTHLAFDNSLGATPRQQLLSGGSGVVISRDLARSRGISAGGTMDMLTPTGIKSVKILAVVPYFSGFLGTVAMNIDDMRTWFDRPGSTILEIQFGPGADHKTSLSEIKRIVGHDYFVMDGDELMKTQISALAELTVLMNVVAAIVVFVAAMAVFNALMFSVIERRRELSVLRAIGSTRYFMLRSILAEAVTISMVGGISGLAVGLANQFLMTLIFSDVLSIDISYRFTPVMILIGLATLLLCVVGAAPPAIHAARLNIIEAISVE